MKKTFAVVVLSLLLTSCATTNIRNDPNTLVDDFAVLLTLGLIR